MQGSTILITGANGSLALPTISHLLTKYPSHHLLLTVRNPSSTDTNTARLLALISSFPSSSTTILPLDLSSLPAVHAFASSIATKIDQREIQALGGIVCNAFTWSTTAGLQYSASGIELSMQVNHIAQLALVLRLIGSFGSNKARITFLASDSHIPGHSGLEAYPPVLPSDLDLLVRPPPDKPGKEPGRGFYRYAMSKLAVIMCMYELNHRLALDPKLKHITAVAIDPGCMPDSRCYSSGIPASWSLMMRYILGGPFKPLLKRLMPGIHLGSTKESGADVAEITVGDHPSGYYTLLERGESSVESRDREKQRMLWERSLAWGEITRENTVLESAFL